MGSLEKLMDIVVFRLLRVDIPGVKVKLREDFRDVMARFAHETLMQVAPLMQLTADIKNALAFGA